MIFDDVIESRRSIRKYSGKEVPERDVAAIVNAARISPSAKNRQPWYFCVLTGESKRQFLDDYDRAVKERPAEALNETGHIMRSAPVLITVYMRGQTKADLLSIGGAMYSLCLKATDLGYGSLWVSDTDIMTEEKYKLLAGVVVIGYAEESPPERSRKPLSEISNMEQAIHTQPEEDTAIDPDLNGRDFVFISYSHRDIETVTADIEEMRHHGILYWSDRALPYGRFWNKEAIEMIRSPGCKVFVLYVSYHSLSSDNVFKEFMEARQADHITILPVLIGKTGIRELIQKMRENGLSGKADTYESFFGAGEEMLYISRSSLPRKKDHFQHLLTALFENGISQEYEAYDHFLYEIRDKECTVTGFNGTGTILRIPESISGYPVTAIGESAFAGLRDIEQVRFPGAVKHIGAGAFKDTGLKSIDLPFTINEVETACFRDCRQLEKAVIRGNIVYLAEALFRGCVKLKEFMAPSTVTRMEEAVFRNCYSIEQITLPESFQTMTEGGFYGCRSLRKLLIPSTAAGAEIQSFDTCPMLERTQIGEYVFECGKGRKCN